MRLPLATVAAESITYSKMCKGGASEKRTTDLKRLALRHSSGGVTYAVHDPLGHLAPNETTSGSMFIFCPQLTGVGAHDDGEIVPWVWVRPWMDLLTMTEQRWLLMDQQVDDVQRGNIESICPTEQDYLEFLHARRYLVPRRCSDGTSIYEAALVFAGACGGGPKDIHYKLPSKLMNWMHSGMMSDLSYKIKKWHGAWGDSRHSLRYSLLGGKDVGYPMYEVIGGNGCRYWFSKGCEGKVGQAHLQVDDGAVEVRPVVFMQGGPIDPFLGRSLSPGIQDHVLGTSQYRMPLSRAGKQPGLPNVDLIAPPLADPAAESRLVLEWSLENVRKARMVLTLQGEGDAWVIVPL